ncbi:MAG: ABC transporter permease [Anaerolineae bacterium]
MLVDIATVFRKEWRELLTGGGRRSLMGIVVFGVVFGILLPLQAGLNWVKSPVYLFPAVWTSLFMATAVIADAIAGERERHTLETLLATRLHERAILLGKMAAAISYGTVISWGILLVGLLTVNLAGGAGPLAFYSLPEFAGIILLPPLGAGMLTEVGILVALQAATVRQVQQALSLAVFFVVLLPVIIFGFLPAAARTRVEQWLTGLNFSQFLAVLSAVLLAADTALLLVALARFKRDRLILD